MRIFFQKEKVKKIWGREKVKLAGSWRNMQMKNKMVYFFKRKSNNLKERSEKAEN